MISVLRDPMGMQNAHAQLDITLPTVGRTASLKGFLSLCSSFFSFISLYSLFRMVSSIALMISTLALMVDVFFINMFVTPINIVWTVLMSQNELVVSITIFQLQTCRCCCLH